MSAFAIKLFAGLAVVFSALSLWKLSLIYASVALLGLGTLTSKDCDP